MTTTQAQALRINGLCRNKAVCFYSDAFAEEAIFFADFGDNFEYKDDQPTQQQQQQVVAAAEKAAATGAATAAPKQNLVKTIEFPSLQHVLTKTWLDISSRFFPLSPTFVKSRVLAASRAASSSSSSSGAKEAEAEAEAAMERCYRALLADNKLSDDKGATLSPAFHALLKATKQPAREELLSKQELVDLCATERRRGVSILSCSVIGSFLSQEVIKAMSKTGEPAFNVFVFSAHDFVAKAFPIK
jgi:hypothetical protein